MIIQDCCGYVDTEISSRFSKSEIDLCELQYKKRKHLFAY